MTATDPSSGSTGGLPPVGSLAAEAAQLLDALAARLAEVRSTVGDPGAGGAGSHEENSNDPSDGVPAPAGRGNDRPDPAAGHLQCVGWCPVCRSADLLRGERPEVAGKLVDSAIVVISALRSLLPATAPMATDPMATDPTATDPMATDPTATQSTPTDPTGAGPAATGPSAVGDGGAGHVGDRPPRPSGIERIDIR